MRRAMRLSYAGQCAGGYYRVMDNGKSPRLQYVPTLDSLAPVLDIF